MTIEIVGTLRNAKRVSKSEDPRGPCLSGQVYGDTKGRFFDGDWITTSTIVSEEGDVFQTRFSAYRVESWAEEPMSINESGEVSVTAAANDNVPLSLDAYLLVSLAEECTEVGQRISKALRFGLSEVQPGQSLSNADRIAGELTDLIAVMAMCEERGLFSVDESSGAISAKIAKVHKYMDYARTQGALAA